MPSPDALGIILKSPAPETAAIRVIGGAALALEGVRISDAARAGIEVESGSLVLSSSRVEGTRAVGENFGSGVVARAETSITVRDSVVTGSAGVGVYFEQAFGAVERSSLDANAQGGVRVSGTDQGSIILQDSVITGNGTAGVVVLGGRGIILKRTAVTATTADAQGVGDGVVVLDLDGAPSSVSIEAGTTLADNARVGLLVSGASSVTVDGAVVTSNDRGGIWLQRDAGSKDAEGVAITGTAIADNGFIGVAATLGASMRLSGSAVLSTVGRTGFSGLAEIEVADGIGLLAGARARIEGNDIDDNPRVGIVADGIEAAGLYIGDNTVSQSPVGIILQRPKDQVPTLAANTFESTDEDLRVPTTEADLLPIAKNVAEGLAEWKRFRVAIGRLPRGGTSPTYGLSPTPVGDRIKSSCRARYEQVCRASPTAALIIMGEALLHENAPRHRRRPHGSGAEACERATTGSWRRETPVERQPS